MSRSVGLAGHCEDWQDKMLRQCVSACSSKVDFVEAYSELRECIPFCCSVKFVGVGGETFLADPFKLDLLLCNMSKDELKI